MKKYLLFFGMLLLALLCLVSCGNEAITDMDIPTSIISRHNQRKIYSYMPLSEFIPLLNDAQYIEDAGVADYILIFDDKNNIHFFIYSTGSYTSVDSRVIRCYALYEEETYVVCDFGVDIDLIDNKVNMVIPESVISPESQKKVYSYMPLDDLLSMFDSPELIDSTGYEIIFSTYKDKNGIEIKITTNELLNKSIVYDCAIIYEGKSYFLLNTFGYNTDIP